MISSIYHHPHLSMSLQPPLLETILIASLDGPIVAYDLFTGTILARFNGGCCPRNGISLIGDNLFAVSNVSSKTGAGSIHLYYWWSPSCMQNIPVPEPVAALAASIDGTYLFSGGISGQIHSLTIPSGNLIRSFSAHENSISCLEINCDGSLILSGSDDGTIAVIPMLMLLDSSLNKESSISKFSKFTGHGSRVTGLTTSMVKSNGIMISSSLDWTCKVWSLVNRTNLQTVRFPEGIWCTVVGTSETELYAGGADGMIYRRRLKVGTRKQVAQGGEMVVWGGTHGGAVVDMKMLNYGKTLLTVSEDGWICAWEVDDGKMISGFRAKIGGVSGVVVVKGCGGFGTREIENDESGGYGSRKEASMAMMEVAEMEDALKVVAEDRERAINNLESAISINERLLNLMLKEANAIAKFEDSKDNNNHD